MTFGNVQVDRGCFQVGVSEQQLHSWQVCPVLEQVRREAMAQGILVMLMICTPERSAIAITRGTA
jgi:hypothetical protein